MDGVPQESRVKVHKEVNSCECTFKTNLHILVHIEPCSANPILEESVSANVLIIEKRCALFKQHIVMKILG